jgi:hypothetical protein
VGDGIAQEVCGSERAGLQRDRATLEAGEVEQVGHQLAESLGLQQRHPHGVGIWLRDTVDDVLEHGVQRGDRRAQFV